MGVAAAFIDGAYLEKVLRYDHGEPRINFEKLARVMVEPDELLRAYYYNCLPYQSNPPQMRNVGGILPNIDSQRG